MASDFKKERQLQDEEDLKKVSDIEAGQIIYDNVTSMIKMYPGKGAQIMERELAREIKKYGKNSVMRSLAKLPKSVVNDINTVIYYEEKSAEIHHSMSRFAEVITGTLRTNEEGKLLGNAMDEMTAFNEPD